MVISSDFTVKSDKINRLFSEGMTISNYFYKFNDLFEIKKKFLPSDLMVKSDGVTISNNFKNVIYFF